MSLESGTELSHFRLVEKIGEGGMGVVWKAIDTTLNREVAVKILPDAFAQDPERLARFEREAKLLASLNHTNIATVHGLHESEGSSGTVRFLSMELVPGEDLACVLEQGPMTVQDALTVAGQIAEALEAAHDHGVIHRDLKPANIQLTPGGQVKVLDFGLAKAFELEGMSGSSTMSPTVTSAGTLAGTILGTAAYMSPEQAKAKRVDRRADIWAFGVVVIEMLSGSQVFKGDSISETLATVMMTAPDWEALPAGIPPGLRRLLYRCLEKDPQQRLRDIGEARIEIQRILSGHTEPELAAAADGSTARPSRAWLPGLAGLAIGAMVAAIAMWNLASAPEQPLRKLDLNVRDTNSLNGVVRRLEISPDGTRVAYASEAGLHIRALDRHEPVGVSVSSEVEVVFWSPDSQWIGFVASGRLMKVRAEGGEIVSIGELGGRLGGGAGASWGEDGTIVFSRGNTGLLQISSRGGDVKPFLELDPEKEGDIHEPHHLPDDRGVLFVSHTLAGTPDSVELVTGGERRVVLRLEGQVLWSPVYSPGGYILYRREPTNAGIWAVPFSLESLEVTGDAFLVVADGDDATVSEDGTLVFRRGASVLSTQLVWVDRKGIVQGEIGQPQEGMSFPSISPDGRRVAVSAQENENRDIWIHDVVRATKMRLSFGESQDWVSTWSPDGTRIVFSQTSAKGLQLFSKAADGTGKAIPVVQGGTPRFTPDGNVVLDKRNEKGDRSIYVLDEKGETTVVVDTQADERNASVSPDGRLIAYVSNESARNEVLITRFPSGEGKWQVSDNGGAWPLWSPDGKELFYMTDGGLYVVSVGGTGVPELGTPVRLFSMQDSRLRGSGPRTYSVAPDGRFVMIQRGGEEFDDAGVSVVQNWLAEFRDRP